MAEVPTSGTARQGAAGRPSRGAVFLDRDNTLVRDPGFLHDPQAVELLPGVVDGLAMLARADWPLVVVSNQSGIARGRYDVAAYASVMERIAVLLAPHGIGFLATYFCPHHPEVSGPCACRKPGTALFEQAAREHGLDLARSWFLGDRWRDVAPALAFGARGVLITRDAGGAEATEASAAGLPRADDLAEAAALVLAAG